MTKTQYQSLLGGLTQVHVRLDRVDQRLDQVDRRLDQTDDLVRSSHAELRRHFDVVAEHLEHKIGLVAEGLMSLGERFEASQRQTAAEFAQVRSEFRLAYTALDRRVSALENATGA
jgi:hypothetical protein